MRVPNVRLHYPLSIRLVYSVPCIDDELRDSPTHRAKRSEAVGVSRLGAYVDLQPVHMRDLRQLDESYSESNETEFVIRKQAILVNADPIRAIILRDATLVFVPEGADGLLSMLIKDFHECVATKGGNAPFEFRFGSFLILPLT